MRRQRTGNPETKPDAAGSTRIALVVDDEPLVRQLISAVLAKMGWQIIEASDGAFALGMAAGRRVDLLVTDVHMSAIDGFGVAGALRRRDPALPVLMVSGEASAEVAASEAGYRFLAKPFELPDLRSIVEELVQAPEGAVGNGPESASVAETDSVAVSVSMRASE